MKINKKRVGGCILSIMLMTSLFGCSTEAQAEGENNDIVVLKNQESEINETLKLKKIGELDNFDTDAWAGDHFIVGSKVVGEDEYLNIFNILDKTMITLTEGAGYHSVINITP